MKLLSWNVNGLRAIYKKGAFNTLFEINPDIICLQETKAHPEQLSEEVRSPAGYFSYFDHSKIKKGHSGVAIYLKTKFKNQISKVEYGIGNKKLDQEGRFLAIHLNPLKSDSEETVIINCYFPNAGVSPERFIFKMEYYDKFLKFINKLKKDGKKIIFCGDINTAHKEIDIARPKENEKHTGFLPIERAWIDKIIFNGYIDTFRFFYPKKIQYSWWDMKTFARNRNVGWRIDYFFISENLKNSLKKAEILDNIMGSDHCPILLELK
ncbi:MAG: exodeoxyribonuclease III [bacterium]|nr:exodeoxyribonuclease III [bacterium]